MHSHNILRVTFLAAGLVGLAFGLTLLLAARQAIASYGLGLATVPALLFARATGAALVGLGVVNLLASFDRGSRALWALVVGNLLIHILGIGADFSQPQARNAGVFIGLAVHVVFIVAFGYCLVHWRRLTARPT